jgi:hypothetical protein
MSDAEWKLLKETMERKATIEKLQADLEKFKGIDPDRFKQLEAEKPRPKRRRARPSCKRPRPKATGRASAS